MDHFEFNCGDCEEMHHLYIMYNTEIDEIIMAVNEEDAEEARGKGYLPVHDLAKAGMLNVIKLLADNLMGLEAELDQIQELLDGE